jgi:hypothetical protein
VVENPPFKPNLFFAPRPTVIASQYDFIHPVPEIMKWNAPGLTTGLLKKCFYPKYDFNSASAPSSCSFPTFTPEEEKKTAKKNKKKPSTATGRQLAGMRRGTRVDNRVKVVLELKRKFRIPEKECSVLEQRSLKKKRVTKQECYQLVLQYTPEPWLNLYDENTLQAAATKYQTLVHTRDPHTRLLCSYWVAHGFRLVATQVPCGIRGVCATRVDAILLDNHDRLVVAEIKTGAENYLHHHTNYPMSHPFIDHNDCVLHQYYLQLAFTVECYCTTYPELEKRMGCPRLFRVTPTLCESYPLPTWVSGRMKEALSVINEKRGVMRRG